MEYSLSIGILTYNSTDDLSQLLKQISQQSLICPVFVVDPLRDSRVSDLCARYKTSYTSSHLNNLGYNRNLLVDSCKTDLIAFLDPDCRVGKDWLEQLLSRFSEQKKIDAHTVAVSGSQIMKHSNKHIEMLINFQRSSILSIGSAQGKFKKTRYVDHVPTMNSLFECQAIRNIGGFSSKMNQVGEDLLLGWQLQNAGFSLVQFQTPKVMHIQEKPWFSKMFHFGRAQSLALIEYRKMPPVRYFISLSFVPLGIIVCTLGIRQPYWGLLPLIYSFSIIGMFLYENNKPQLAIQALIFTFASHFCYSLGLGMQLLYSIIISIVYRSNHATKTSVSK